MQTNTDWIPAILMLSVGAVIGVVLMWRILSQRRAESAEMLVSEVEDLELRDLHAKRDALIQQLRELEDTAGKMTPEQLAHERHDVEIEAARALRDIERHVRAAGAVDDEDSASEVAAAPMTPRQRALAWAGGSIAVVALLSFAVWQSANTRQPGEGVTGGSGMMGGGQPANDAELLKLQAAVQEDPANVDRKMDLARAYMMREDLMSVYNLTETVLQEQPGNPRALSYGAIVRLAMGQPDVAEQMLATAIKAQPDLLEAHVHMALVHIQTGNFDAAEKDVDHIAKSDKREADALRGLIAEARSASAGMGAMGAAPPQPMQQPGARSGSGREVSGTLTVDPALQGKITPGSVIYVILRPAGGGTALAVSRLATGSFPLRFNVGEAESMSGDPLPPKVRVEARIDADGNPMSKGPTDPIGFVDNVDVGATNVAVVMK